MRLSGLQKDVLSLYRALLKSAFAKSATEESWRNRMREPLFLLGKFRQLLYCIMFLLMVYDLVRSEERISRQSAVRTTE
jgi:hypothetical protein